MTGFVLNQFELLYNAKISQDEYVTRTKKYCDFINQSLNLEMFIGENPIFEGFTICNRNEEMDCVVNKDFHLSTDFSYTKLVEDLVSRADIYLTPESIKRIGM